MREARVKRGGNHDAVCFHSQQLVEKYFKGRLQEAGIAFPKTHDLVRLLGMLLEFEPSWRRWTRTLASLNKYAVLTRYPGVSPRRAEARRALRHSSEIRKLVRQSLGLK
jgi:HEPN domain-containing protein